jgi:hypothetical protein
LQSLIWPDISAEKVPSGALLLKFCNYFIKLAYISELKMQAYGIEELLEIVFTQGRMGLFRNEWGQRLLRDKSSIRQKLLELLFVLSEHNPCIQCVR